MSDAELWRCWREAVKRPMIDEAIGALYARLDAAVAARGPTCWASGKCCKFDSYGHRLYVTGLEIARFLGQTDTSPFARGLAQERREGEGMSLPQLGESGTMDADACVYQVDGLCSVHAVRPMGCRIFFCQEGTQTWQQALYEDFLKELRALHEEHALPYRYMEWRAGLQAAWSVERKTWDVERGTIPVNP